MQNSLNARKKKQKKKQKQKHGATKQTVPQCLFVSINVEIACLWQEMQQKMTL